MHNALSAVSEFIDILFYKLQREDLIFLWDGLSHHSLLFSGLTPLIPELFTDISELISF